MNLLGRGCHVGIPQALLVLHLKALLQSGLGEPEPQINGKSVSISTLQENESRDFTCQAEGWRPVPLLTWYLNGEKQEVNGTSVLTTSAEAFEQSSSTFTVTAQKNDRELNCTITDPKSGRAGNASVLLNVQFKPEIIKMDAKYKESRDPGLLLVLFVLVRANPPANITWVDQDGHVMVNTSDFLVLDAKNYPWLTNHTVQVQVRSLAKNYSFSATNEVGIINSSIAAPDPTLDLGTFLSPDVGSTGTWRRERNVKPTSYPHASLSGPSIGEKGGSGQEPVNILEVSTCNDKNNKSGLLHSSIEVPVLWLIIGGAFGALLFLFLNILILCLLFKKRKKHLIFKAELPPSDSNNLKLTNIRLPRENMSLPSNLQLNNLSQGSKGKPGDGRIEMNVNEEEDLSEQDSSEIYAPRGFGRFPTVGYIYKVSSMSSDEIWL